MQVLIFALITLIKLVAGILGPSTGVNPNGLVRMFNPPLGNPLCGLGIGCPVCPEGTLKVVDNLLGGTVNNLGLGYNCVPVFGSGRGRGGDDRNNKPPIIQPPIVKPPIDPTPIIQPPIVKPPIIEPPIIQPPIIQPPIIQPPIVKPPIDITPIISPPIISPPIILPPITEPENCFAIDIQVWDKNNNLDGIDYDRFKDDFKQPGKDGSDNKSKQPTDSINIKSRKEDDWEDCEDDCEHECEDECEYGVCTDFECDDYTLNSSKVLF